MCVQVCVTWLVCLRILARSDVSPPGSTGEESTSKCTQLLEESSSQKLLEPGPPFLAGSWLVWAHDSPTL